MYSIYRGETIISDTEMITRVVDRLNDKFDSKEVYHHGSSDSEMFEFHMRIDNIRREAWEITFMGHTVISGSDYGLDYEGCQEEDYITLEPKNEEKIFILAVTNTINYIENFIRLVAISDASNKNKEKWIDILKDGLQ